MKNLNKPSKQTEPLNEDISALYQQFDDNLQQYHEIHFNNTTQRLREKWPLIKEIGVNKSQ